MKVYVAGLIYFNGCNEAVKRMYAPDGTVGNPPHYASLWVAADLIDDAATDWLPAVPRVVGGVPMIEFQIPEPADISFPDVGPPATCDDLENKLSKLKKKKQDGTEEDLDVNPATAQTIAEVTIRSGRITPCRFKNIGLVEWTIASPSSLQITATLKNNPGALRTITFRGGVEAEVVFLNTHDLFEVDDKGEEKHHGDHVDVFIQLDPEANATVVSQKPPGSVGPLKTDNPILKEMRKNAHTEGNTPGCCRIHMHELASSDENAKGAPRARRSPRISNRARSRGPRHR